MKRIKNAMAALVIIGMIVASVSEVAYAASAQLRFTDPSTTVGAEVEVTAKLSSSSSLKSLDATLTYDTSKLKFVSGDSATGGEGTVTIAGSGSGTSMSFNLKFQALAEGSTKIEISEASGKDSSGSALQITKGSSAVTIGAGDPSLITQDDGAAASTATGDGPQVEVNGAQYTVNNDFSDALIPEGFTRGEATLEGTTCQAVTQESSGATAMYLVAADGSGEAFFLYDADKGSFSPFEQVEVSKERYIILLNDNSVDVPSGYQETTLTLNGSEFPAWQNTEKTDYYMVYALNSDGEKTLYQYDTVDQTYQRYAGETAAVEKTADKSKAKGLWGKILQFVENFLDIAVILAIVLFLLLVVVLIVISVKLRHRNLEIDDLYDEYGIDMEDKEEELPAVKGKGKAPAKKQPKKKKVVDEDDFDDFGELEDLEEDDFEEEDYEEYNHEEEYGSDLASEFAEVLGDDDLDDPDFEEDYGLNSDPTENMIDDLDDLLSLQPDKKRGHGEPDDTFKVDFIDLD